MNNLDNLFKLLDAGYTKEEINQLLNPVNEDEDENSSEPQPEVNKDTSKNEHPVALKPIEFEKLTEALEGLNAKIKELDTSIKKGNILGSSLNLPKEQTAEDVLASIITPDNKK